MTEEQKFLFDLNGFLVIENVLSGEECAGLREQIYDMKHRPEILPAAWRHVPGGRLETLIDHPKIISVLHEITGPHLRLDYGYVIWRGKGQRHPMDLHHGGPTPEPMFRYSFGHGRIFSGLVRVIFELNDVGEGDGGTCFLPGSHKSNYQVPKSMISLDPDKQSPFLYRVSCQAGAAIIFTENVAHGGPVWQNVTTPRVAVFYSYNHLGMQFHKPNFPPEVIAGLSPERKLYFRDTWMYDFENDRMNS